LSHPSHRPRFDHVYTMRWRVQSMKLVLQFAPSTYFRSLRSRYSPLYPVLLSPLLCETVSRRYKTTSKILIFVFMDREDHRIWIELLQVFPELIFS
jgi:hypothetical protein